MKFEISNLNIITSNYGVLEDDFWVTLQIDISEKNGKGSEVFNVSVVSCKRLIKIVESEQVVVGRGLIIANEFTKELVIEIFEKLLTKSSANNWKDLLNDLSKYFEHQ